ncbi:MAG TPA: Asd/ArgC dimerization domain-containing protein [Candidatus Polarisedimenticolia bacterium]
MAVREAARSRRTAHLALFDATTLIAKGVKEQLLARKFPIASVRLYTSQEDPEQNLTEFGEEAMLVSRPDPEALGPLDIAFLCGASDEGARYLDWPDRGKFVAIDLTNASNEASGIPLVNADVNPAAIIARPGVIAAPHPIAHALSSLLAPIQRGPGLLEAAAVVLQPASDAGDAGIEELYRQTASLMNFQDLPTAVFGRQLAFNLLPAFLYKSGVGPGGARPERIEREVRKVTGGEFGLSVEVLLAPVFHCHTILAHVVLPEGATRDDLLAGFEGNDAVQIADAEGRATPVDRAGKTGLLLAGVRPAGRSSSFWALGIADNLTSGTARNAVRIAEALLEQGLVRGDA